MLFGAFQAIPLEQLRLTTCLFSSPVVIPAGMIKVWPAREMCGKSHCETPFRPLLSCGCVFKCRCFSTYLRILLDFAPSPLGVNSKNNEKEQSKCFRKKHSSKNRRKNGNGRRSIVRKLIGMPRKLVACPPVLHSTVYFDFKGFWPHVDEDVINDLIEFFRGEDISEALNTPMSFDNFTEIQPMPACDVPVVEPDELPVPSLRRKRKIEVRGNGNCWLILPFVPGSVGIPLDAWAIARAQIEIRERPVVPMTVEDIFDACCDYWNSDACDYDFAIRVGFDSDGDVHIFSCRPLIGGLQYGELNLWMFSEFLQDVLDFSGNKFVGSDPSTNNNSATNATVAVAEFAALDQTPSLIKNALVTGATWFKSRFTHEATLNINEIPEPSLPPPSAPGGFPIPPSDLPPLEPRLPDLPIGGTPHGGIEFPNNGDLPDVDLPYPHWPIPEIPIPPLPDGNLEHFPEVHRTLLEWFSDWLATLPPLFDPFWHQLGDEATWLIDIVSQFGTDIFSLFCDVTKATILTYELASPVFRLINIVIADKVERHGPEYMYTTKKHFILFAKLAEQLAGVDYALLPLAGQAQAHVDLMLPPRLTALVDEANRLDESTSVAKNLVQGFNQSFTDTSRRISAMPTLTIDSNASDEQVAKLQSALPNHNVCRGVTTNPHSILQAVRTSFRSQVVQRVNEMRLPVQLVGASSPEIAFFANNSTVLHNCGPILSGRDEYRLHHAHGDVSQTHGQFTVNHKYEECDFVSNQYASSICVSMFSSHDTPVDVFVNAMVKKNQRTALIALHLPVPMLDARVTEYICPLTDLRFVRDEKKIHVFHMNNGSAGYSHDRDSLLSWLRPWRTADGLSIVIETVAQFGSAHLFSVQLGVGQQETVPVVRQTQAESFYILPSMYDQTLRQRQPRFFAVPSKRFEQLVTFAATCPVEDRNPTTVIMKMRGQMSMIKIGKHVVEKRWDVDIEQLTSIANHVIIAEKISRLSCARTASKAVKYYEQAFRRTSPNSLTRLCQFLRDNFTLNLGLKKNYLDRTLADTVKDVYFGSSIATPDVYNPYQRADRYYVLVQPTYTEEPVVISVCKTVISSVIKLSSITRVALSGTARLLYQGVQNRIPSRQTLDQRNRDLLQALRQRRVTTAAAAQLRAQTIDVSPRAQTREEVQTDEGLPVFDDFTPPLPVPPRISTDAEVTVDKGKSRVAEDVDQRPCANCHEPYADGHDYYVCLNSSQNAYLCARCGRQYENFGTLPRVQTLEDVQRQMEYIAAIDSGAAVTTSAMQIVEKEPEVDLNLVWETAFDLTEETLTSPVEAPAVAIVKPEVTYVGQTDSESSTGSSLAGSINEHLGYRTPVSSSESDTSSLVEISDNIELRPVHSSGYAVNGVQIIKMPDDFDCVERFMNFNGNYDKNDVNHIDDAEFMRRRADDHIPLSKVWKTVDCPSLGGAVCLGNALHSDDILEPKLIHSETYDREKARNEFYKIQGDLNLYDKYVKVLDKISELQIPDEGQPPSTENTVALTELANRRTELEFEMGPSMPLFRLITSLYPLKGGRNSKSLVRFAAVIGPPMCAKSTLVREVIKNSSLFYDVVVPSKALRDEWKTKIDRKNFRVGSRHSSHGKRVDVLVIDEVFNFTMAELMTLIKHRCRRNNRLRVVFLGDPYQGDSSNNTVDLNDLVSTFECSVLRLRTSLGMPIDSLYIYLKSRSLDLGTYETTGKIRHSIFFVPPSLPISTKPDFAFSFFTEADMATMEQHAVIKKEVLTVGKIQGMRARFCIFFADTSVKQSEWLINDPGRAAVAYTRHEKAMWVFSSSDAARKQLVPASVQLEQFVVVNGGHKGYKDRLILPFASDLLLRDVKLKPNRCTKNILANQSTFGSVPVSANVVKDDLLRDRFQPEKGAPMNEIQTHIFSRVNEPPPDTERLDVVLPTGGISSFRRPELPKQKQLRAGFHDVEGLAAVQSASDEFRSLRDVCDRQFSQSKPIANVRKAEVEGLKLYKRFRECFYRDELKLFTDLDASAHWLNTRIQNFVSKLEHDDPFGVSADSVTFESFRKTQSKVKPIPDYAASDPYGQQIIASPAAYTAIFSDVCQRLQLSLPGIMRPDMIADIGYSDDDLSRVIRERGLDYIFGDKHVQFDLSKQDSTHSYPTLWCFALICLDCGCDAEKVALYVETCISYRVRAQFSDLFAGNIAFNLGSGDPFTLPRNCIMMLTSIANTFVDAKTASGVQKGDDWTGHIRSFNLHPNSNLPSMRRIVWKPALTNLAYATCAPYHAGRFWVEERLVADPVRVFYKHLTRLADSNVPVSELYTSFKSRAVDYSPREAHYLKHAVPTIYEDLTPSDIEDIISTVIAMNDRKFFSDLISGVRSFDDKIIDEKDCIFKCVTFLRPDLPLTIRRSFRGLTTKSVIKLLKLYHIPYQRVDVLPLNMLENVIYLTNSHAVLKKKTVNDL